MLSEIGSWLRSVFLRRRVEREMQEEMRTHLERATERLIARGLSPEEARIAAQREFGNIAYLQEQARDARGGRWLEGLLADARFGLRQFARTPLTTITMIVVLTLGMGSNTALFAVLHSLATQPPAGIKRDDALVRVRGLARYQPQPGSPAARSGRSTGQRYLSYPEVLDYARHHEIFSGVAAWASSDVVVDIGAQSEGAVSGLATYVSADYFRVLGVRPMLGAGLPAVSVELSESPFAVISYSLWTRLFGQSADVLGRRIQVNDISVTIVGVTPAGFKGAGDIDAAHMRLWLPLGARAAIEKSSNAAFASYDSTSMSMVGRLQPGVSAAAALPAVQAVAARAHAQTRDRPLAAWSDVAPLLSNNESERPNSEMALATIMASTIALLILLVTATNASALLVGQATTRRREIAVRLSLGAPRSRIIRQLITENILLAIAAGTLGLLAAFLILRIIGSQLDSGIVLDWPALAFTFSCALGTGLLFGISPALHATRLGVSSVLKDAAASVVATRSRMQRGLVVAQIALTQPLLVALATMVLVAIREVPRRIDSALPERLITLNFDVFSGTTTTPGRAAEFLRLQQRYSALPGVVGAVPFLSGAETRNLIVYPDDRVIGANVSQSVRVRKVRAASGYFAMLNIRLVRGRDFLPAERAPIGEAIIASADLVQSVWGAADPIGRRLLYPRPWRSDTLTLTVVGVVDDAAAKLESDSDLMSIYDPSTEYLSTLLVRTRGPGAAMIPLLRSIARAEVPDMPMYNAMTLAQRAERRRANSLQAVAASAGLGLLALLLSAVGLYAVVAFAVAQRTREIGIRTALGAEPRQVVGLFLFRGLHLSALGLAIGLPAGLAAIRVLGNQIRAFQVNPISVSLLTAIAVVSVAAFATWLPARKAAGVDPLMALRTE